MRAGDTVFPGFYVRRNMITFYLLERSHWGLIEEG